MFVPGVHFIFKVMYAEYFIYYIIKYWILNILNKYCNILDILCGLFVLYMLNKLYTLNILSILDIFCILYKYYIL